MKTDDIIKNNTVIKNNDRKVYCPLCFKKMEICEVDVVCFCQNHDMIVWHPIPSYKKETL